MFAVNLTLYAPQNGPGVQTQQGRIGGDDAMEFRRFGQRRQRAAFKPGNDLGRCRQTARDLFHGQAQGAAHFLENDRKVLIVFSRHFLDSANMQTRFIDLVTGRWIRWRV